jgi:phospholipid-binding lipoprotein MlaA
VKTITTRLRRAGLLGALLAPLLGGCATTPHASNPDDPWQGYNRAMYGFNTALDRTVMKPAAKGYDAVTPPFVRGRVSDFFSNLGDVSVTANALLQGKPQALEDFTRFLMNSTFGLAGLFDVATPLGLPKHQEDIGMTLATWGVPQGPYVVLPLFGPSTLRNAPSPLVDGTLLNPLGYYEHPRTRWALTALKFISLRASLLPLDSTIDEAYDPYAFVRNAYLQHRHYLLKRNNPKPAGPKQGQQLDSLQQELLQMQSGFSSPQ